VLAAKLSSGPILASTRETIERRDDLLSRARVEAEHTPEMQKVGSVLGKYQIVRALSVGGMAEVFLAVHKSIGGFEKPVALKRIRRSVLEHRHYAVEHFLNEAKIAATLSHPNIAQIFDVGEDAGLLYLAMEYVNGKDLRVLLRRLKDRGQKLPLDASIHITQQVARGLHHAYTAVDLNGRQLKAIHRDVSPHNIVIGHDASVKLVDFGVAISASTGFEPGSIAGKHNYMSPEQLQGQPLDSRSDLFSLGVVLYEMLVGEKPFEHETTEATLQAVTEARYRPVSEARPDLPKGIDALMAKLLARKPSDRLPDGNRVADELTAFAGLHAATGGVSWLRATLPLLFSGNDAEDFGSGTPRSDSFSFDPTQNRLASFTSTPSHRSRSQSRRLPEFTDERSVSQLVHRPPNRRVRAWMLVTLAAMAGLLALLWWRY
jgi:serine/threonine protein kinase